MMLSANLVRGVHEFLKRPVLFGSPAVFVRFKSPAVDAIRIVENAMEMRMVLVYMAGHEILVFAFEKLLTYLLTELQCSLRSNFPRFETDDKVLGENRAFARPVFPNLGKIMTCLQRIRAAPLCDNQSAVIRFFRVGDVFQ